MRDTTYGFYNIFDFSVSLSLSTKIYGFFKPFSFLGKLSDKLQMVRHVMTPSISFSAAPDFGDPFWGYYGNYERINSDGTADIDLTALGKGLYIVKSAKTSIKVMNK